MTVRELMAVLGGCDPEAVVEVVDGEGDWEVGSVYPDVETGRVLIDTTG